jgi:hypothetical protein
MSASEGYLHGEEFEEFLEPDKAANKTIRGVYVNHNLWCASPVMDEVIRPNQLLAEEG